MRIKAIEAFILLAENECNFSVHKLIGIPRSNLWGFIDEIEKELGVKLIERRKQLNTFSPEGLAFVPAAIKMMKAFEEAKSRVTNSEPTRIEGTLVVSTTQSVVNTWLVESIDNLNERYPDLKVHVFADDKLSKEIENSADILVRPLGSYNSDLEKKWYIVYHHGLFANKDYLSRKGIPLTPEDLAADHAVLAYGEHEFTYFEDINWHIKGKFGLLKRAPTFTLNSTSAIFYAAARGMGICSAPTESNKLYNQNLVRVLPHIDGPVIRTYFAVKRNASPTTRRNSEVFMNIVEDYIKSQGIKIHHEEDYIPKLE